MFQFECCGADSFKDWRYRPPSIVTAAKNYSTPDSCCKTMSPGCAIHVHPSNIYYDVSTLAQQCPSCSGWCGGFCKRDAVLTQVNTHEFALCSYYLPWHKFGECFLYLLLKVASSSHVLWVR